MNAEKQMCQHAIHILLSLIVLGTVIAGCTTARVPSATPTPTIPPATNTSTKLPELTVTISTAPNKRALWVWNADVVTDNDARERFLAFIQSKRINTIYLHAYALPSANPTALAEFIANAGDADVELLAGDPSWALSANHNAVLNFVQDTIAFTQNANRISRPTGLHFDIEPYLLDEWESDQQGTMTQYLDLLVAIRAQLNEAQSPMLLGADIPFWYDTPVAYNGETKPLHQHVQDIVDYVAIMDYRDIAKGNDGIIAHAQDELRYANRIGKLVTIGVETNCIEPTKITFCEEGEAVMEQELYEARVSFEASPAFHGFAIHDYEGYAGLSQLTPTSTPSPTELSSPTIVPTPASTPTPAPEKPPTATVTPLPPTPTSPPLACPSADADGTVSPAVAIATITFVVNGVEQVVDGTSPLQASVGDQVQVKEVTICPAEPFNGSGGRVYIEFDPVDHSGKVTATEVKGTQAVPVTSGFTIVPGGDILWNLGDWRHISVVTVHYPESKTQNTRCAGGACEIDDRVIVSIE